MKKMMMVFVVLFAMVGSSFGELITTNPPVQRVKSVSAVRYEEYGPDIVKFNIILESGNHVQFTNQDLLHREWLSMALSARSAQEECMFLFEEGKMVNFYVGDPR